ncbi:hypothetical protein N0O92_16060 [Alkalihalobacillus sp. MEB130]|uniref:hypothetical protein n=1 Tax=Alkalihalobacillus sp. MEB130 TaxID=2976704 RepID=UPI0028DE03BC|nr:hypothetical protein [Alkalihalobacillus sp. MEB130]MDT8861733.1 hypothetical protein [Alkalihalobacillus sp. MEB130]
MNKLMLLNSKLPNMISFKKNYYHFLKSVGVWVNGKFSWLNSKNWDLSPRQERGSALSIIVAFHKEWKIQITILQEWKKDENSMVYTFITKNQSSENMDIKFVVHQQRMINTEKNIAFVSPSKQAIIHYGERDLTLFAANFFQEKESQLSVGKKEQIWSEKEGKLALSPLCQEGHESMVVTRLQLAPWQETYGRMWEITGESQEEVFFKHDKQIRSDQLRQVTKQIL